MGLYKDAENSRLADCFPAVADWPINKTSEADGIYNCFAYVAGDTNIQWAPFVIPVPGYYWPTPVTQEQENTIQPFLQGYKTLGFEGCEDGSIEEGYEKIVLYVDGNDVPRHAAIQRIGGMWQSKLGPDIDVSHSLESLASHERFEWKGYGYPKYFMKRKKVLSPILVPPSRS